MTEGVNYVTLTQYIEVGERTLIVLPTHILPCSSADEGASDKVSNATGVVHQAYANLVEQKKDQYAWFNDHSNQEVMVCVHDVITAKAVENLLCQSTQSKSASSASKPVYEFRRSDKLRMILTFKPVEHKQHVLFPNQTSNEQILIRRAAFISEYGRRVLPYLGMHTYEGAGYTTYNVLPVALHVYVDNLELTSRCGIFKMLCLLDPKCKISADIPSYFKLTAKNKPPEVLPQASIAAFKRTFHDKPAKASSRITRKKVKREAKSGQQPTIVQALANYQKTIEQKHADEINLPDDILESVWDFDSTPPGNNKQLLTTTDLDRMGHHTPAKEKSNKHQQLATGHSFQSITDTKTRHVSLSPAKKQQNELDFFSSDPFDELLADQTKARKRPIDEAPVVKEQRKKFKENDEDIDPSYLGARLKPSTASADVEDDVLLVSSENSGDSITKYVTVEDICFDVSTPDITLSPVESEKDVSSQFPQSEDVQDPMCALRSTSQPEPRFCNTRQGAALSDRRKSFSTTESDKFGDITNTMFSPDEDAEVERSAVNLSQGVEEGKGKKKKRLPKSGAEIIKGAKSVADLNHQQLTAWMRLNHPVLMNIFKRSEYSWRHEQFNTNPKMRAAMKWRYDSRRFTGDQVKLITDILLKIFCWRHMKYFNYVMSVLLPECLVRVIADVHGVTFDEAEVLMFNFEGQAKVDLTV